MPISDAELRFWTLACHELLDRIIDARLAGKTVKIDQQPELAQANIAPKASSPILYVPTGRTYTLITI